MVVFFLSGVLRKWLCVLFFFQWSGRRVVMYLLFTVEWSESGFVWLTFFPMEWSESGLKWLHFLSGELRKWQRVVTYSCFFTVEWWEGGFVWLPFFSRVIGMCFYVVVLFSAAWSEGGILGQVWYLIVSIAPFLTLIIRVVMSVLRGGPKMSPRTFI